MSAFVEFLRVSLGFVLSGLITILWYVLLHESKSKSFAGLAVFPIRHWSELADPRKHTTAMPIALCYFMFMGGIASLIGGRDPRVFLAGWCVMLLYELNAIMAYFIKSWSRKWLASWSVLVLCAVGYGAVKTIQLRNFQLMNALDFVAQIIFFGGSVAALSLIIFRGRFAQEPSSFFVFFGLIIYSFLHSLSTVMLAFDFFKNFDFSYYATLSTLVFWLVSIPWIKHIKSKLT